MTQSGHKKKTSASRLHFVIQTSSIESTTFLHSNNTWRTKETHPKLAYLANKVSKLSATSGGWLKVAAGTSETTVRAEADDCKLSSHSVFTSRLAFIFCSRLLTLSLRLRLALCDCSSECTAQMNGKLPASRILRAPSEEHS